MRIHRKLTAIVFASLVLLPLVSGATAAQRIALVIGNDQYQSLPRLAKAVADATSYADALKAGPYEPWSPGGESWAALTVRVGGALRRLARDHQGELVVIACHGGVIRMVLAILLQWPLPKLAAFEIDYASITQLLWIPPMARLQLVNFAPWRDLSP